MRIFVTPTFDRAAKKLHRLQKDELDAAVKTVAGDAQIGEEKVGDLAGIRVYKFRMSRNLVASLNSVGDTIKTGRLPRCSDPSVGSSETR